jgi:N utilization substance protein B
LPTKEDLAVNIKIAGNEMLWRILEDESFKRLLPNAGPT